MLRCPKCSRTYETDAQKFCTHDGGRLVPVEEKPADFDPNATVHGNFAQFKEMGAMPGAPASPAEPPAPAPPPIDLNKTVMSRPQPAEPSAPTVSDLAPTSKDLPPVPVDHGPASEELGEFETQWSMPREPVASELASADSWSQPPVPEEPAVENEPPAFEPEQSFATQLSMPVPDVTPLAPPEVPSPAPPTPEPPAVGPSANQYASAAQASKMAAMVAVAPPKKNRRLGLIFAIVAVLLLFFVGVLAVGAYFYWNSLQNKTANDRNVNQGNSNGNKNGNDPANKNTNANVGGPANTNTNTSPSPPPVPAGQLTFTNDKFGLTGPVADHFVDFSFNYPKVWELNPAATGAGNFVDLTRRNAGKQTLETVVVSFYESAGSVAMDRPGFDKRIAEKSAQFAKQISKYQKVSEGETTVNNIPGYEFRFQGKGGSNDSLDIWGRMIFIPPNHTGDTNGITLVMYATSLSTEVHSIDDVGIKGDLPVILNSFRLGH